MDAVLVADPGFVLRPTPALDEGAVGVELHDRWRRRTALVARRAEGGALLVFAERARTLQYPDVIVGVDGHAGNLPEQPVVGQRLGPERVDLELRRLGRERGR